MCRKRGRFIPCRGGGTATTYYTDSHDVDEDKVSIVPQGGLWSTHTETGITLRIVNNSPTDSGDAVASRLIYLS